ncbi:hypothetical protein PQJ75_11360 [Rhodoplanes sp. TEM]|uniref:Cell division protein FtsL n=1 Tax=Rhodoplanes tepidamans TaxID=200616 RepID=A0ABT5J6T2_RHOTP|nr:MULTISPECIES: hypothetical protein [Rhodoplanes]MDC7785372.1 hypothetical protein [Rhodoplanes tepidamans]MDC7984330.1 hypothetical protein [Rhodoplanes sp. TEM]MDQ0353176.1 cell division protein FtsL [Rhodoplanes tepidamans]
MRLLNVIVVVLLVVAAAYVYKIKFEATVEAERVAKLRTEIARERDKAAALRAEAAKLENPGRIQALAQRHLKLQLLDATQIESFDKLPPRPAPPAPVDADPIGAMLDAAAPAEATGSVPSGAPVTGVAGGRR